MNLNENFKSLSAKQQGCLVISLLFVTFIVTVSILMSNDKSKKDWKQMSFAERESWIKDYLKSPNEAAYQLMGMMDKEIRSRFNYPKEVDYDFGGSPTFSNAVVVLADSALVLVAGGGTAKNAFGVKSGFKYQCIITINPSKLQLERVTINEDQ